MGDRGSSLPDYYSSYCLIPQSGDSSYPYYNTENEGSGTMLTVHAKPIGESDNCILHYLGWNCLSSTVQQAQTVAVWLPLYTITHSVLHAEPVVCYTARSSQD